jgi:hypothetical protein
MPIQDFMLSTPQVLQEIRVSENQWRNLRKEYNIEPICRGRDGFIFRRCDIEHIFNPPTIRNEIEDDHDPIMIATNKIG